MTFERLVRWRRWLLYPTPSLLAGKKPKVQKSLSSNSWHHFQLILAYLRNFLPWVTKRKTQKLKINHKTTKNEQTFFFCNFWALSTCYVHFKHKCIFHTEFNFKHRKIKKLNLHSSKSTLNRQASPKFSTKGPVSFKIVSIPRLRKVCVLSSVF